MRADHERSRVGVPLDECPPSGSGLHDVGVGEARHVRFDELHRVVHEVTGDHGTVPAGLDHDRDLARGVPASGFQAHTFAHPVVGPNEVDEVLDSGTAARQPVDNLLDGPGADIDVLIGWTGEESAFTFALGETYASATKEQVLRRARDSFGDGAADAYAAYEAARPGARPVDVLIDLTTDELFRKPTLAFAESRAARGRPVWAYEFAFPTPAHDGRLGAPHCLDLPFVFDNFDKWSHAPFLAGMDTRIRDGLARTVHRAWISFIRTGDPNHPTMPRWDRYDRQSRTTMRFDAVTAAVSHLAPN
ncbi:carboxylesterase family protein [Streptomyces sp. KS 21]|uniref:carboxylesterase family protein n=1 Tax=Streptomyces sp. KS 21 TaxID=2485150 RepID=UPI0010E384DE|nr:carboxylesterase family protein [Streptomyces sp. KS 21]TDU73891.1 carboxylesterase family protein [Streptomyces sp. KS 21]